MQTVPAPKMKEAVKMFFAKYTDFSSRSRRSEYWWFQLFNFLVVIAAACLCLPFIPFGANFSNAGVALILLCCLYGIWFLVCIVPSLALMVRRCHDIGYSGWVYAALLLLSCIPVISFLAAIAMLVIALIDSKPGANKWGVSPKYAVGDGDEADAQVAEQPVAPAAE